MAILYIILGIAALVALLLYLPVKLHIWQTPNGELEYRVKYLHFTLLDSAEDAESEATKKPSSGTKQESETSSLLSILGIGDIASIASLKRAVGAKGLCGMLSEMAEAVRGIFSRIFKLLRRGTFHHFSLQIVVADEDAADAAMHYGTVCGIVYPTIALLESGMKFRRRKLDIRCDFSAEETQIAYDVQLNFHLLHVLWFLWDFIENYLKRSGKK